MDGEIPASAGGPAGAGGGRYGTGPHRKVWFKGKNGDEVAREVWITIPETEGERRRGLWDENGVVGG